MLNDAGSATLRLCDWLVELWFRASNTIGRLCILGEARNTWNARAIRTLLWTGAVHAWDMRSGLTSSLLEWPACLSPNLLPRSVGKDKVRLLALGFGRGMAPLTGFNDRPLPHVRVWRRTAFRQRHYFGWNIRMA